jgi:hypothetical protein
VLRDDDEARARLGRDEAGEVSRHRRLVVADEDPVLPGGKCEDRGVGQSGQPGGDRRLEIECRLATKDGEQDDVVEVRIGLKTDLHDRRSAASLA